MEKKVREIVNGRVDKRVREITENKQVAKLILTAREYGATEDQITNSIVIRFKFSEKEAKRIIKEFDEELITI